MINEVIKRIIRAAIKSFPIDVKKKREILQNMIREKNDEEAWKDEV